MVFFSFRSDSFCLGHVVISQGSFAFSFHVFWTYFEGLAAVIDLILIAKGREVRVGVDALGQLVKDLFGRRVPGALRTIRTAFSRSPASCSLPPPWRSFSSDTRAALNRARRPRLDNGASHFRYVIDLPFSIRVLVILKGERWLHSFASFPILTATHAAVLLENSNSVQLAGAGMSFVWP